MRLTINKSLPSILKKATWWTTVLKAAYLLPEEVPGSLVSWGPVPMTSNKKWSISNTKRFEGPHLKWRTAEPLAPFGEQTSDVIPWRARDVSASLVLKLLLVLQVFFGLNLHTNSAHDLKVHLFPVQWPGGPLQWPRHTQTGSSPSAYVDIRDFSNTQLSLSPVCSLHRHGQNLLSWKHNK